MDQLKDFLAICKKQQFWILTGLIVILAGTGYVLARLSLADEISKRTQKITSEENALNLISSSASTHPNSHTNEQMDAVIESLKGDVNQAWELQYAKQQQILVWPEEALLGGKSGRTLRRLEALQPIEANIPFPPKEDDEEVVTRNGREVYAAYIDKAFKPLGDIIGTEWKAELQSRSANAGGRSGDTSGGLLGGGFSGGAGLGGNAGRPGGNGGQAATAAMEEDAPLVVWSTSSQQALMNEICSWKGTPTTLEMCYAQEDLWILEALLNIIAQTNDGSVENFQAPIKEIEWIRIGRSAVGNVGDLTGLSGDALGGAGMGDFGGLGMGMGDMGRMGAPNGLNRSSSKDIPQNDPADERYVDINFEAISGEDLRRSMQSQDPEDAYFAVAKRIPVRLRFSRMDPQRITDFLTNCSNADIVLEVRQVRYNTDSANGGTTGGMGGRGGDMFGGGLGGDGGDDDEDFGGMMNSGRMGAQATKPLSESTDIPVEFYGVVYLYNPVDIEKLGLEKVNEETEVTTEVGSNATADSSKVSPEESNIPNRGAELEGTPQATSSEEAGEQPANNAPTAEPAQTSINAGGATTDNSAVPTGG